MPGVVGCMAAHATFTGVTALCETVLYPKDDNKEYHNLECIRGSCEICKVSKLKVCSQELSMSSDALVSWRRFEMVFVGRGDDGSDRHALRLEHKMTPPVYLVTALKASLEKILTHNFEAKWQDHQFKACMDNLSPDAVVSVIDFAENYSFKWKNEVQSQHWFSFQVTILVHITFRIHPEWDGVDSQTMLLTEYHFYISDDKSHDNQFVQHCFSLHQDFLIQQGFPLPVEYIVFSDGCTAQFKCAKNLYFMARYLSLTHTNDLPLGCTMQWNWFGSGHGKGRWDGAGAHVKQALRAEQVKPQGLRLHCASDVVQFLRTHMTREYAGYSGARRLVHRYFYDVTEVAVNLMPSLNARTVDGTRSFHQVRSVNLEGTSLQVWDLSCFCKFCMDGGDGPCDNATYVPAFILIRLEPCETTTESRRERGRREIEERRIHPRMTAAKARAATLEVGDHFAVLADEGGNGPEFWILQCIETLHAVEESTKENSWG